LRYKKRKNVFLHMCGTLDPIWSGPQKGGQVFCFYVFRAICLKFEVPSASRRFTSVNKKGGLFKNEKYTKNFLTLCEFNSLHREIRSKRGE
jgi:hypothetical protein